MNSYVFVVGDSESTIKKLMARIACIDTNAVTRKELRRLLENALQECRKSIGHLKPFVCVECSREQVLMSSAPELVAIGPGFSVEEACRTARDVSSNHPEVPILVLLQPQNYSLRVIKQIEKYANSILLVDDKPERLIHSIESLKNNNTSLPAGKLITCIGVKGGVGTTSVVSGLAHAAQSMGKSVIVVDLSVHSAFPFYMGAASWQSSDYRCLLMENTQPDEDIVKRMITVAPNGIHILLPPNGGAEVRERWLRSEEMFEITLSIVDFLKRDYDIVLVDVGCVEGVLPFALNSNANSRLVVSSNDPASVHLLRNTLLCLGDIPGEASSLVVLNEATQLGLNPRDIQDFLVQQEAILDRKTLQKPIPFDSRAGGWIGTKNSFYTEANHHIQSLLEEMLVNLAGLNKHVPIAAKRNLSVLKGLKALFPKKQQKEQLLQPPKALPFIMKKEDKEVDAAFAVEGKPKLKQKPDKPVIDRNENIRVETILAPLPTIDNRVYVNGNDKELIFFQNAKIIDN